MLSTRSSKSASKKIVYASELNQLFASVRHTAGIGLNTCVVGGYQDFNQSTGTLNKDLAKSEVGIAIAG